MNLDSIFDKKPKTEISTEINETQPEKLSYKRFLKKEYFYMLAVSTTLSAFVASVIETKREQNKEHYKYTLDKDYQFTNFPDSIEINDVKIVLDDFKEILPNGEDFKHLMNYLEHIEDFNQAFFKTFSNPEHRERLLGLKDYLTINETDVMFLSQDSGLLKKMYDPKIDEFINKTSLKKIKERKYYLPSIESFLFEEEETAHLLNNKKYIEGRKRAQDCDVLVYEERSTNGTLEDFASDEKMYNFIRKLSDEFDVHVSEGVISAASINNSEKQTRYWNLINIDLEKNKNVLEFAKGSLLYHAVFINLLEDKEYKMNALFSNPVYRKNVEKLKSVGISVDRILSVPVEQIDILKSENFINLLENILKNDDESMHFEYLDFDDFFKTISSVIKTRSLSAVQNEIDDNKLLYQRYNLDTKEGCADFLNKYNEINKIVPNAYVGDKLGMFNKMDALQNIYNNIDSENPAQQPDKFLGDPALEYLIKLGYDKQVPQFLDGLSKRMKSEWIMRVSRNMFVSGVEPTEENFKEYFKETILLRSNPEVTKMKVFEDRNVVCLAHNEKWQDEGEYTGKDRFMPDSLVKELQLNKPKEMVLFRGEKEERSLVEAKDKFLDYISNNDKLTVFMDGHGDPENIYLSEGSVDSKGVVNSEGSVTINYTELAKAFKDRENNGLQGQPILILEACSNQNFIRNLYQELEKNGVKSLPIIIGSVEFGQYGFSNDNDYGTTFFKKVFQENKSSTTIQDFIKVEQKNNDSDKKFLQTNPSIFFPIQIKDNKGKKKDIHWQIAEKKYKDHPDERERINPYEA